jgi:hypothetical protein
MDHVVFANKAGRYLQLAPDDRALRFPASEIRMAPAQSVVSSLTFRLVEMRKMRASMLSLCNSRV